MFDAETVFLGKVVSKVGESVILDNVEKVKAWPIPRSVKVEKFLEFVNYHREHIRDYAKIASALYELTGSKAVFKWEPKQQEAFDSLRSV